ncbi:MAG: transposase [Planctomycetes bacterium]|nr:transposase [Planctomycetota bacterium]
MRRPRLDGPGERLHIGNRGVARRTLFENLRDIEEFLECVIEVIDRGELRLIAFVILTNHFHLVVESPVGAMSSALRRLQFRYVRYFNATRGREGPLVGGRFWSRRIDSVGYLRVLIGYIDDNVIRAGLTREAHLYPFCSAHHYVRQSGPPWLAREWVETEVCRLFALDRYDPARYRQAFPRGFDGATLELIDRQLQSSQPSLLLDSLFDLASSDVVDEFRRLTALADGSAPGAPVIRADTLRAACAAVDVLDPNASRTTDRGISHLDLAAALLMRQAVGLTFQAAGELGGLTPRGARDRYRKARELCARDDRFAGLARAVLSEALRIEYRGSWRPAAAP